MLDPQCVEITNVQLKLAFNYLAWILRAKIVKTFSCTPCFFFITDFNDLCSRGVEIFAALHEFL